MKAMVQEINLFNYMDLLPPVVVQPKPVQKVTVEDSPIMRQFNEMKKKHPDAILLFRVDDFYETFCEDAVDCSQILGITLTRRATNTKRIELAGFPHHALDVYLPKIVRAGRRVAICEQLKDPKLQQRLVKRGGSLN